MNDLPSQRFATDAIGVVAAELVGLCSTGRVLAVFERSAYLHVVPGHVGAQQRGDSRPTAGDAYDADNALLCIAHNSLGAGPLQINIDDERGLSFNAQPALEVGATVEISANALSIRRCRATGVDAEMKLHDTCTFNLAGVPTVGARSDIGQCTDPRGALRALMRSGQVVVGAAPGLEDALVAQRSAAVCAVLLDWVSTATPGGRGYRQQTRFAPVPEQAGNLLGLGLGLTPAGDDYLVGVLLGLRFCRRDAASAMLERFLGAQARQRTNRVSRAHLACVCDGWYQDVIVDFLWSIDGSAQRLGDAIERLAGVGQTSGMDLLGGFSAALDCSG